MNRDGPTAMRCSTHPNTETYLRCSRCGKPICARCVVQTPVGGRCRECASVKKAPIFLVGPTLHARATLYGLVVALVGGFVWAQLGGLFGLSWLVLVLLGYGIGEAVSRGARGRISRGLMGTAGALTVLAVVMGRAGSVWLRLPSALPLDVRLQTALSFGVESIFSNLLGLLFLVLAVVIAANRVR